MVTTKRTVNNIETFYGNASNVNLLEKTPESYVEFTQEAEKKEDISEARRKMQENLEKLMHYDRYNEQATEASVAVKEKVEQVCDSVKEKETVNISTNDDDYKPSSTTLQFTDGNNDGVYNDLQRQKDTEKISYGLTGKGKLLVVLYALAVTVILALIVLNTGVLSVLRKEQTEKINQLNSAVTEYNQAVEEKNLISSDENIKNIAINDLGFLG